jgi:hypothetical protein
VDRICLNLSRDMRQAVVNTVTNLRVLQNAVKIVTRWGTASFSRRTLLCRLVIQKCCTLVSACQQKAIADCSLGNRRKTAKDRPSDRCRPPGRVKLKGLMVFWNVGRCRNFGGTCCLHLRGVTNIYLPVLFPRNPGIRIPVFTASHPRWAWLTYISFPICDVTKAHHLV